MNVLITGCSSGFGELAALAFADRGDTVFATMRTPGKSEALNARPEIHQVSLDVCDEGSVHRAIESVITQSGRLDVVVNNAGIEVHGAVHLLTDTDLLRQFDTNVLGVVRVVRHAVPHMIEQGGGTIVNVGSIAGMVGPPYSGAYGASKHAVEALSESMHFELSHLGIRVRLVEPGQFATALVDNSFLSSGMRPGSPEMVRFERYREAQRRLAAGGEPGDANEVAQVIVRAATEEPGQLRYLVGADAELIAAAKRGMTFEEFDVAMRATIDFHD